MDGEFNAERSTKSGIIDQIRLIEFEHDLSAVERDSRTEKLYEMTPDELQSLRSNLEGIPNGKKVNVLVGAITESRHKREADERKKWDDLDGGGTARMDF